MNCVKSEFMCIREEELEAIQKLTPKMNINIKDPVVCKECFDSQSIHNSFLRDCSEVEENIRDVCDNSATESRTDTSPSDLFVKTENLDKEFDINEMEMSIKIERVDIKSEYEAASYASLQSSNNEPSEKSDCKDTAEDGCKNENGWENQCNMKIKRDCTVLYKCDEHICETERHEYETENKKLLQNRLRHKDPSPVKIYRCNDDYESRYRKYIKQHQLKHKDPTGVQMYRCNNCDYETKYEGYITRHQLKHKDPSQVHMYRCNDCDYKTNSKGGLKKHQMKHKDPLQVHMYSCNDCDYKSKSKESIKKHQLKHKDPSQIHMYRCNDCDFETKYRTSIRKHQLKHKDSSEVQMYRCNNCDYESKYKGDIKKHQVKHKDPSQVQMYRCKDCSFETKYKSVIKCHNLKHKGPS